MFETSVVRAEARVATRRLSLLSVSVIAHTAIVFGAVGISIASVDFPGVAPDEYSRAPVFVSLQIPPPLGRPDGGAPQRPQQQPAVQPPAPQRTNEVTAPQIVPDTVTPVESSGSGDGETNPDGRVPGPIGVADGDPNSPLLSLDARPVVDAPAQPQAEPIYQPHEVNAPVLVRRTDPRYPVQFQRVGVSVTVVVRCVIDKNGNVRDAEVVVPSSMAPFNTEVLNVLPQWKYRPATLAGRPVDSYLMLTVHFAVKR